jgi:hypothetical protein
MIRKIKSDYFPGWHKPVSLRTEAGVEFPDIYIDEFHA